MRGVESGKVVPSSADAKLPEYAIEDGAGILGRAARGREVGQRHGEYWLNEPLLFTGQIHGYYRSGKFRATRIALCQPNIFE